MQSEFTKQLVQEDDYETRNSFQMKRIGKWSQIIDWTDMSDFVPSKLKQKKYHKDLGGSLITKRQESVRRRERRRGAIAENKLSEFWFRGYLQLVWRDRRANSRERKEEKMRALRRYSTANEVVLETSPTFIKNQKVQKCE